MQRDLLAWGGARASRTKLLGSYRVFQGPAANSGLKGSLLRLGVQGGGGESKAAASLASSSRISDAGKARAGAWTHPWFSPAPAAPVVLPGALPDPAPCGAELNLVAPACPSPAAGAAQAGAALQCGFLSSITMEMVTNEAGLLTRFLSTHSPSSCCESAERPRCSQQWAPGCPCPSPCPKPLGTGTPGAPGDPDRVSADWVCTSQSHPPPPCPQRGS